MIPSPLDIAPGYLRALADQLESMMGSGKGEGDKGEKGPGSPEWNMDWKRDFEFQDRPGEGSGSKPPPWDKLLDRYRGTKFLDPMPVIFKRRYVYDREVGDKLVQQSAEEYSDIPSAAMTDICLDELDDRLTRKAFDIPFYQTELPPEGKAGRPYTFFMIDVSGSMDGIWAMHACALAQIAAEKVFSEGGVFVWMPYGSTRKDAVEFESLPPLIECMRGTNFNCGTTYIGENLRKLSDSLSFKVAYPHDKGKYTVPEEVNKDRSKVIVVHDGTDEVKDVDLRIPVFSIAISNQHEALKKLSAKTRGKYLHIDKP